MGIPQFFPNGTLKINTHNRENSLVLVTLMSGEIHQILELELHNSQLFFAPSEKVKKCMNVRFLLIIQVK